MKKFAKLILILVCLNSTCLFAHSFDIDALGRTYGRPAEAFKKNEAKAKKKYIIIEIDSEEEFEKIIKKLDIDAEG